MTSVLALDESSVFLNLCHNSVLIGHYQSDKFLMTFITALLNKRAHRKQVSSHLQGHKNYFFSYLTNFKTIILSHVYKRKIL